MSTELTAKVVLQDGLRFIGSAESGYAVYLDASPEAGGGTGMLPMELILIGLAGCSAMDVIAILRKKQQPVQGLEVRARGHRRDEHPTAFTAIELEYIVRGSAVDPRAVARAIELSKGRYCPVWAMLGESVLITSAFRVTSDDPVLAEAH